MAAIRGLETGPLLSIGVTFLIVIVGVGIIVVRLRTKKSPLITETEEDISVLLTLNS